MTRPSAVQQLSPEQAAPAPAPRAIVAEDDADCRLGLAVMLRDLGYEVTMARNGSEALAWFRSFGHVALLVTDLAMPRMDGISLTRRLAAIDPSLAVVAVTGAGQDQAAAFSAMRRPNMTLLPKPFDRSEFCRAVQSVVAA